MNTPREIKKVLVVGSGTMGSQIALQVALSGHYQVALVDTAEDQLSRATAANDRLLARAVERGRVDPAAAERARAAITTSTDLEAEAATADLMIEAVFEDFEVKRGIFERVDRVAPAGAILASNSSSIAISRLAAATGRPELCCNLHFFHPVTVMELCEVVQGPATGPATIATALEFIRSINRVPVHIRKEVHGFIVNRVLVAAMEEALRLYEGGFAGFEDIDVAVEKGLNWPMGPFKLLDFSGIDVFHGVIEDRHRLGEGGEPSPTLAAKVAAGELGRKTGRGFYDYGER